jgi:hypothetical protein
MLFGSAFRPAIFLPDLLRPLANILRQLPDGKSFAAGHADVPSSLPAAARSIAESVLDRFICRRRDVCGVTATGYGIAAVFRSEEERESAEE